jgi:hypothetical protein
MPKKVIDIEESSEEQTDDEGSEPETLTKPVRKTTSIKKEKVYEKPKKVLSEKQQAVLEGARRKRTENIAKAKQNAKIEAAKLLIEQDTNLKLKSTEEPKLEYKKKSKTKTIIIESESESSSEEQIIIKKKHNKKKPKQKYKKNQRKKKRKLNQKRMNQLNNVILSHK